MDASLEPSFESDNDNASISRMTLRKLEISGARGPWRDYADDRGDFSFPVLSR